MNRSNMCPLIFIPITWGLSRNIAYVCIFYDLGLEPLWSIPNFTAKNSKYLLQLFNVIFHNNKLFIYFKSIKFLYRCQYLRTSYIANISFSQWGFKIISYYAVKKCTSNIKGHFKISISGLHLEGERRIGPMYEFLDLFTEEVCVLGLTIKYFCT